MSRPLLVFILFSTLSVNEINAQKTYDYSDSVKVYISIDNDTIQSKKLISLSEKISRTDLHSALDVINLAIKTSLRNNYFLGLSRALYRKSVLILRMNGNYDSVLYYINESMDYCRKYNYEEGIANNYNLLGSISRRKGYYSTSLNYHIGSKEIFSRLKDTLGLAKTFNFIGVIYKDLSKYDSALVYYLLLLKLSEQINYKDGITIGLLNLGQVYLEINETKKAKEFLFRSLQVIKNSNDKQKIGLIYNKIGTIFYKEKENDSALFYYNQALKEYELINIISGKAYVLQNIAILYENKEHYNRALEKYLEAKSAFEEINLKSGILKVLINLAVFYEIQHDFSKSLIYYDSCIVLAREIDARDELLIIYNNLHKTYKLTGNKSKALEYLEKYVALKDSIYNIEKAEIIADLELKYEKEKDEAKILTLNNENLQKDLQIKNDAYRKNLYLATGVLLLIIAFFLILYFKQRLKKNKQLAAQELLKVEEEKKLSSAQALIEGQEVERMRISKELHDGVGVLLSTANLYISSIEDEKPSNKELVDKAYKMVDDANSDVRKISRNLMPTVLATHGLEEALQDLIESVDQLPGKYGDFQISGISRTLSKSREMMIYRLVQELVSNTLKHAHAESIDLELTYSEHRLILSYHDDGIGFDFEKEFLKKSVGLKSIKSRVDYLKGKFIPYNSNSKGASFKIDIPL